MAKRLIDANALNWGRCPTDGKLAKAWLDEAPTVDAVEVVRCKDCKSQSECKFAQYQGNDGFCSYGERKGDGNA